MKPPKAYRDRLREMQEKPKLSPDPDEVLPGATLAEQIDADLDIKTRKERAEVRRETEERIGHTEKARAITFAGTDPECCLHCTNINGRPTQRRVDSKNVHWCAQCRMVLLESKESRPQD